MLDIIYGVAKTSDPTFSTSIMEVVQMITIFVLFILVFFGAYYTSRFLGNVQKNKTKDSNLKVIEAMQVGVNKNIQLVKIGDEYILIGVTKDKITYLKEVSPENIKFKSEKSDGTIKIPFSKYLGKLTDKNDINNPED